MVIRSYPIGHWNKSLKVASGSQSGNKRPHMAQRNTWQGGGRCVDADEGGVQHLSSGMLRDKS